MFGVSVFPGMEVSIEENLKYIEKAKECNCEYIFTSLHIPEANTKRLIPEFEEIISKIKELNLKLIVDISKDYINNYQWENYNIFALRLDFGFSDEEIISLSKKYPIQLNTSTITKENLDNLISLGLNLGNITTCHNYYPRKDTGISINLLKERNRSFKELGLITMAFVPGSEVKRGPMFEGLPTCERHRGINPLISSQELFDEGVDIVLVGDSKASNSELEALRNLKKDTWVLPIKLEDKLSKIEKDLLFKPHRNRTDPGEFILRCELARKYVTENIPVNITKNRPKGSITLDNILYKRYQGELQITLTDFPQDERVNLIGSIMDEGYLISRIKPGDKFIFIEI